MRIRQFQKGGEGIFLVLGLSLTNAYVSSITIGQLGPRGKTDRGITNRQLDFCTVGALDKIVGRH